MKTVFLDKDGALVDDNPCNVEPRYITLCSGAGPALRLLARLDFRLIVVSDQAAIARGLIDEAAMAPVVDRIGDLMSRERVALDDFYYCPQHPKGSVTRSPVARGGQRTPDRPALIVAGRRQVA